MSTKEKETKADARAETKEGEAEPILNKWEVAFIRPDSGHTASEYFEAATVHDAIDLAEEKYPPESIYAVKKAN